MKRLVFYCALLFATMGGVFVVAQKPAYAVNCNINFYCQYNVAHTYFSQPPQTSQPGNIVWARCDILPQPALLNINKVDGSQDFIKIIGNELFSPPQDPGCHNIATSTGAAFIIDAMLGYRGGVNGNPAGGGTANGITYARNNWVKWVNLVNSYEAANSDPSSPFKVYWDYWIGPGTFCGSIDSGYDWTRDDPVFYRIPSQSSGGCPYDPWGDVVVRFQFQRPDGSIGTFDIDKPCGNLSGGLDTVPPVIVNHPPVGTLSITCNAAIGQEVAAFTYSDQDGATAAYITASGQNFPLPASPGSFTIPQSATNPYAAQLISLSVKDVGPVASNAYGVVATAPTQVPCVTMGCTLSEAPVPVDPYMHFTVTASVSNNVGSLPPGGSVTLNITPPVGGSYSYSGTQPISGVGSPIQVVFSNLGPTNQAGLYKLTGTYQDPVLGISQPCPASTFSVAYMPYVNVFGGDAQMGESPSYLAGVSTCAVDAAAGAYSWNNHSAGFSGAGGQYAVQTLAGLVDFASALGSSNTPPSGLSFANFYTPPDAAKINPATGLFGGYFGAVTNDCDFTSDLTSAPSAVDLTVPATVVAAGSADVRYVSNADVYIKGNITYGGVSGWAKVEDIPSFKLVVAGGDIYIDSSVAQLDGLYVAESNGASGGRIFTCATGLRAPVNLATPGAYSFCNQKLTVNGAFVAKNVIFGRTNGSVGQAVLGDDLASNHAAEIFNYTPELWLPRGGSTPSRGYTAITGLPPVL